MTDNTRATLVNALEHSIGSASWITDNDRAAVRFALETASLMDWCIDNAEIDKYTVLAPKYLAVLQQLHLTPETRTQGKQNDETTGSDYANAFIRLVETKTSKPASGGAKRRPSGGSTSGRPRPASTAVAKARP